MGFVSSERHLRPPYHCQKELLNPSLVCSALPEIENIPYLLYPGRLSFRNPFFPNDLEFVFPKLSLFFGRGHSHALICRFNPGFPVEVSKCLMGSSCPFGSELLHDLLVLG